MRYRTLILLVLTGLLAGATGAGLMYLLLSRSLALSSPAGAVATDDLAPAPPPGTATADRVVPAVVSIKSFGGPALGNSNGSGVVIDESGYIATNSHVIEGAGRILVTLYDRRELWAERVAVDTATDLALLKVEALTELPALRFGDSDSLKIGQWLLAVGNPFGLRSTVTAGILSARGRRIDVYGDSERIESFLQTDAAVNPGSSGGALVNEAGELIGINTAILSESGRHEGFNFAIPGNLARRVLTDLRTYGTVHRATLGAYLQTVNAAQARAANLAGSQGAYVQKVLPRGAARRAGLRRGDILTAISGQAVNSSQEVQEVLSRYRPGERIRVTYLRGGRTRSATLRLGGNATQQPFRRVADRPG